MRWTFAGLSVLAVFGLLLIFPQYLNKAVSWSNAQLDKLKYIDQINIPSVREIPFSLGLDLQGGAHLVYKADVSQIRSSDEEESVEGVRDVIERRVNVLGLAESSVRTSKTGDGWNIIVEIPGVTNTVSAINLIGQTPILEFKEYKEVPDQATPEQTAELEARNKEQYELSLEVLNKVKEGQDFSELASQYSADTGSSANGGDLGFVKRGAFVPEFDTAIFDTLKVGEVTSVPVKSQYGWHIIKKEEVRGEGEELEVRSRHILLAEYTFADLFGQDNWSNTNLSGKNLKQASVVFLPTTGEPQISITFDEEGATLFGEITGRNIGKPVAIFLDGEPITIATVQQQIETGEAVITGDFTVPEARDLARRLNAGALPVPITLVSQQTVGASLGQESLNKSIYSGVVGIILISLFMTLYYRFPGFLSVIALGVYVIILLTIFKYLPVTLTLAGIAGVILSFGMAVDANVLVFERLKEELALGKPLDHAIEEAFKRAWLSVRDGHVSTLLTCLILFWFTTSSVQGFAITLAMGILTSLFTAIFVTRTLMRMATRWVLFDNTFYWGHKK